MLRIIGHFSKKEMKKDLKIKFNPILVFENNVMFQQKIKN